MRSTTRSDITSELAILLPDVIGVDDACEAADRLGAALRAPFLIDGVSLASGAGFGVAYYPDHGQDAGRLLQRADIAMNVTKHTHASVTAYDASSDVNTPDRLASHGQLRRGIDDDQLILHYQPQVDLATSRVVGAEALVRWQHPVRGVLPPDELIPLAEQTSLIRPLTSWVLRTALRRCSQWHAAGNPLSVAVNLSVPSLLDEGCIGEVAGLLRESGLPPWALELEITETTAMVDPVRAVVVLSELRALGVRLSIDLARNLGLHVVAEGVETQQAWRRLVELGCDFAQGYWLARPAPAEALPDVIAELESRLGSDRQDAPVPV